jgi:uncharacterized protein (TIGR00297 family)
MITNDSWLVAVVLNTILLLIAYIIPKKLLTPSGSVHGWFLGVITWGILGWQGYAIVMFYFLMGSLVTRVGFAQKEAAGIAEKRSGMRGPENVWGSALSSTLCTLGIFSIHTFKPELSPLLVPILLLGYVAGYATKLSDTSASEIGKAYGKSTFLITTLKPVVRGTEGAISLEGTIAGIIASILLGTLGYLVGLVDVYGILICTIAALIATNIESVIGAVWQNKYPWLTNELVNIINTAIGSLIAIGLGSLNTHLW